MQVLFSASCTNTPNPACQSACCTFSCPIVCTLRRVYYVQLEGESLYLALPAPPHLTLPDCLPACCTFNLQALALPACSRTSLKQHLVACEHRSLSSESSLQTYLLIYLPRKRCNTTNVLSKLCQPIQSGFLCMDIAAPTREGVRAAW